MLPRLLLCTLLGLSAPALSFAQEPSSHLDQVIERGHLTVCTTGDYKPTATCATTATTKASTSAWPNPWPRASGCG